MKRLISAFLLINFGLFAQSTWQGTTNSMNDPANWSPNGVPTSGANLIFPGTSGINLTPLNNIGPLTISGLTISDAYTLTGSAFTIGSTQTLSYGASGSNINLGGVTLSSGATWNIQGTGTPGNTITSNISGPGNLDLTSGVLILKGNNTYGGTTTLGVGTTLQAQNTTSAFGTNSNVTIGSGATLALNNFSQTIGSLTGGTGASISLGSGTLTITTGGTNFQGTLSGANGGITYSGTGTLIISGNNGSYSTQANPAPTTITNGTLQLGSTNALGNYSNIVITSPGILDLNGNSNSFGTLSGTGSLLLGAGNVTVSQGNSLTFSGVIGPGSGGLVLGSGAFSLTNATNTYTGTTTIQQAGNLSVNSLGMTSGLIFSNGGGTLTTLMPITTSIPITLNAVGGIDTSGNTVTWNGAIGGSAAGIFTKSGAGTLILGGANNYLGGTVVSQGTLQAGSSTAFGSSSPVTLAAGTTLNLNGNSLTIGSLSGNPGSFVSLGSGTLTMNLGSINPYYGVIQNSGNIAITAGQTTLMGPNTYTGTTTIQGGATLNALSFGSTSSLIFASGGGNIQLGSAASAPSMTLVLNGPGVIGTNTFDVSIGGGITGTNQAFSKIGLGTLTLTGANSNASSITIQGGTLNLTPTSLGSTTALIFDVFGGTFQAGAPFTGGNAIAIPITLTTPGTIDTNGNSVSITNFITGPNNLTKTGLGTLTLTGGNNYSGITTIQNGTLNIPSSNYSANSLQLVFAGTGNGVFQAGSAYASFPGSVVFMNSGTIDTNGNSMVIQKVVAGNSTSTFTKAGTNSLTLTGANIYTGPTNVTAGSLVAGVASTSTSGAFGVGSNMTVGASGTVNFQTFANSVGTLSNSGAVSSAAQVTATSYTQGSGATLTLDVPTSSASPLGTISTTGAISLNGSLVVTNTGGFNPSSSTELILLQSSGAGKQLSGTFSSTNVSAFPKGTINYDYSLNQVYLGFSSSACNNGTWSATSNGTWGNSGAGNGPNWAAACAPGVDGIASDAAIANFNTVGAGTITVTLANAANSAAQSVTLHDLNFNASGTAYTINQFSGAGTITLDGPVSASAPKVTVLAGTHTINAPFVLNKDSRFSLHSGSLTLGATSGISSTTNSWTLSEGAAAGTLINNAIINPVNVLIEGDTLTNNGSVLPTGTLSISGLNGIVSPATVTNTGTMTSGGLFTIGGAGATVANNQGTMSSSVGFNITSGTIANSSTGHLFAGSGQTLAISGGTITNATTSTLGSSSSNLTFSGGTITSSGPLLASAYTQSGSAALTLDVPTSSATPFGYVSSTGAVNLGGTLTVTNTGSYVPTSGAEFILLQSSGTGKQLAGSFTSTNTTAFPTGSISYDYSENKVILGFPSTACNNQTWTATSNGTWGSTGAGNGPNWSGACAPGVSGLASDAAVANLNTVGASSITVTLANVSNNAAQSVTLHDLNFNASTTAYTIQQFNGMGTITLDAISGGSKPKITVYAGNHTINAPIILNQDSRFSLHSGSLTLGVNSGITSTSSTFNLSEGSGPGQLTNYATITPGNVLIEGNTLDNHGTFNPTGTLSISGLGGNVGTATVNNYSTMTSGAAFTIGGVGPTVVNNQGTMSSATGFSFTISSGTVNNTAGGHLFANGGGGTSLIISGGSVVNDSTSTLGSSNANLLYTGGSLTSSGPILAFDYLQSGSTTLNLNVASTTEYGSITASGLANPSGTLNVTALSNFSMTDGQTVNLVSGQSIVGQFDNVSFQNFPNSVIPSLIYNPQTIQLDIRATVAAHAGGTTQATFTSVSQQNVFVVSRKCFQMRDRFSPRPQTEAVAMNRPFSKNWLMAADNSIVEITGETEMTGEGEILGQINPVIHEKQEQLTDKVSQATSSKPWSVYAGPTASFGNVSKQGNQAGFGFYTAGALVGFDYAFSSKSNRGCDFGIGAIADYTRATDGNLFITQAAHGSIYGTLVPVALPDLAFDTIVGFAYDWTTLHRSAGINQTAIGKPRATVYDVFFDIEYMFSSRSYKSMPNNFHIIPMASIQYVRAHNGSYTETGAGIYDLHVDSQTAQSLTSILGARINYVFTGSHFNLRTEVDGGWQREYMNHNQNVAFTAFNVTNVPATSIAYGAPRNSWLVGLDLLATIYDTYQIEGNASYIQNSNSYNAFFYLGFGGQF